MRRRWTLALSIAAMVLVGSCSSGDERKPAPTAGSTSAGSGAASAPAWTEPASYGFVLSRGCGAAPIGRYRVTVRGGSVAASERLDAPATAPEPGSSSDADLGPVTGQTGEEIDVPTLGELLELARTAADDGGEVSTAYDTADGHPVKVTINVSVADQAECFTVSDYAPDR